jgi:hypothetical protein|tara:strand:- start:667 stop:1854 length:1188 start_codon:yes stop_codon:yes gene_type:complete
MILSSFHRIAFTLLAIVLLFGCTDKDVSTLWNTVPVVEITPHVISWGDSSTADKNEETIFSSIGSISTSPDSHLFISDRISQSLKKFDHKGRFIHEIGRRGRGAGEFMSLKYFTVSNNSEESSTIITTDEVNRVIYKFSTDGKLLNTFQVALGIEYPIGPFTFIETEANSGYIFLYKLFEAAEDEDCLFHFFSSDFSQKINCFGSFRELQYSHSDAYSYLTEVRPGNFIISEDKTIYYTPYLYDGFIYTYAFDKELQDWIYAGTIQGLVYESTPIEEQAEPSEYRLTYKEKRLYGKVNNTSLGLFSAPEGMYHFTRIKSDNGEKWFGMEQYDNQNQLKKYIRFKDTGSDSLKLYPPVLHRDTKGFFYVLGEHASGLPEIKQLTLESVAGFNHTKP